ncbi:MAG: hypothetical protein J7K95_03340 [Thermoplasmata archaeon]|nr:hypothetical protein [Thermoplasmata archaeon]
MVEVKGTKNGKAHIYKFSGTSRMREATATPAALAAIMMARGEINSPGVKAAKACVPAREFLNTEFSKMSENSVQFIDFRSKFSKFIDHLHAS